MVDLLVITEAKERCAGVSSAASGGLACFISTDGPSTFTGGDAAMWPPRVLVFIGPEVILAANHRARTCQTGCKLVQNQHVDPDGLPALVSSRRKRLKCSQIIRKSSATKLLAVAELLAEHQDDYGRFFTSK